VIWNNDFRDLGIIYGDITVLLLLILIFLPLKSSPVTGPVWPRGLQEV